MLADDRLNELIQPFVSEADPSIFDAVVRDLLRWVLLEQEERVRDRRKELPPIEESSPHERHTDLEESVIVGRLLTDPNEYRNQLERISNAFSELPGDAKRLLRYRGRFWSSYLRELERTLRQRKAEAERCVAGCISVLTQRELPASGPVVVSEASPEPLRHWNASIAASVLGAVDRSWPGYYPRHLTPSVLAGWLSCARVNMSVIRKSRRLDLFVDEPSAGDQTSLESLLDDRRAVLLGNPGCGKSTFGKALISLALKQDPTVPALYVSAAMVVSRWLDEDRQTPVEVIVDEFTRSHMARGLSTVALVDYISESSSALLVLDGIDEVDAESHHHVAQFVSSLDELPGRVVLTSRLAGYSPLSGWNEYLVGQGAARFPEFASAWFSSPTAPGTERALAAYKESKGVRDLVRSPVLAGMVMMLAERGTLDSGLTRSDLYRQATATLLERQWIDPPRRRGLNELRASIADHEALAWHMAVGNTARPSATAVRSHISFLDLPIGSNLSELLDSELLTVYGPETARFPLLNRELIWIHRTFAEYFAGSALQKRLHRPSAASIALLLEALQSDAWIEILRFAFDGLSPTQVSDLTRYVLSKVGQGDPGQVIMNNFRELFTNDQFAESVPRLVGRQITDFLIDSGQLDYLDEFIDIDVISHRGREVLDSWTLDQGIDLALVMADVSGDVHEIVPNILHQIRHRHQVGPKTFVRRFLASGLTNLAYVEPQQTIAMLSAIVRANPDAPMLEGFHLPPDLPKADLIAWTELVEMTPFPQSVAIAEALLESYPETLDDLARTSPHWIRNTWAISRARNQGRVEEGEIPGEVSELMGVGSENVVAAFYLGSIVEPGELVGWETSDWTLTGHWCAESEFKVRFAESEAPAPPLLDACLQVGDCTDVLQVDWLGLLRSLNVQASELDSPTIRAAGTALSTIRAFPRMTSDLPGVVVGGSLHSSLLDLPSRVGYALEQAVFKKMSPESLDEFLTRAAYRHADASLDSLLHGAVYARGHDISPELRVALSRHALRIYTPPEYDYAPIPRPLLDLEVVEALLRDDYLATHGLGTRVIAQVAEYLAREGQLPRWRDRLLALQQLRTEVS